MKEYTEFQDLFHRVLESSDLLGICVFFALCAAWLLLPWFLLHGSHRSNRIKRLMRALPTSKVKGVFVGLVEVKGTSESALPLTSYLSDSSCVWYSYSIEEQWRRVEVVSSSKGTRTVVRTGWTTIDVETSFQSFYLRDETGDLLVHPGGADVEPCSVMNETCGITHSLYYGKGPIASIADSTHKRRFIEKIIPVGHPLYLVGEAREREDALATEIALSAQDDSFFLISTRDEEAVISTRLWKSWGYAFLGLIILAGIPLFLRAQSGSELLFAPNGRYTLADTPLWIVAVLIYLALWITTWIFSVYNSLIDIKNRVTQGRSQIEVQLQRRFDLIPKLVQIVSAYSAYESTILQSMSQIRAQNSQVPLSSSFHLLAESYPELKSQPLYAELSFQLSDTENRIALAREYYNTIANHYNTQLQIFPDCLIGKFVTSKPVPLLTPEEENKRLPILNFE